MPNMIKKSWTVSNLDLPLMKYTKRKAIVTKLWSGH